MNRKFKVNGMTCGHCAHAVKTAIENLSANTTADVNLEAGIVTVENSPDTDAVKAAITEAGYEFAGKIQVDLSEFGYAGTVQPLPWAP